MTDVITASQTLTSLLLPLLPSLLRLGENAGDEITKQFGADVWGKVKELWGKLRPKVEANDGLRLAFADAASDPADSLYNELLRRRLEALLASDREFAGEIARLLEGGVIQEVAASAGSTIRDAEQRAKSNTLAKQSIVAHESSNISGVKQTIDT